MPERCVRTICTCCLKGCGMYVYVKGNKISRVEGDPEHPASKGALCIKGIAAAKELAYSQDRLKTPLKKTENGFKPISWSDALDTIGNRLLEIKDKYGPEALILCNGNTSSEDSVDAFRQLMALYGSANVTGPSHLCFVPAHIASTSVYGTHTDPDYSKTKFIILWGVNPVETASVGTSYMAYEESWRAVIESAKNRGAKLTVIDPVRTPTAAKADDWIPIVPGTDLALALAMLNVIIEEEKYDKEFVDKWTVGFLELKDHVQKYTPEWAQPITGISVEKIKELAGAYATTKPATIHSGNGFEMYTDSVNRSRAIAMLRAVTGNLDAPGGDVFFPGPEMAPYPTLRVERENQLGYHKYPLFPLAPFPMVIDAILTGEPYKPRAMIVHHGNPALVMANTARVKEALLELEFVVVCDIFKSATAEFADIILPDASHLEKMSYKGYVSAKGGFVALRQKVVDPIGECRPVFEIEYEIAKRMGFAEDYPWKTTEGWINYRLRPFGITVQTLKQKGIVYVTPPMEYFKYKKKGFDTPSKKVELYSERYQILGYDPIPVFREPQESWSRSADLIKKYPLMGTTRKPGEYVHTRYRNLSALQKLYPHPVVRINQDDAIVRGINDGDMVQVASAKGSIKVEAMVTKDVIPRIVVIDYGWGNPWDKLKTDVNALVDDTSRCPVSSATSNRRFLCEVTKVSPS